jgi:hypothetical protein
MFAGGVYVGEFQLQRTPIYIKMIYKEGVLCLVWDWNYKINLGSQVGIFLLVLEELFKKKSTKNKTNKKSF